MARAGAKQTIQRKKTLAMFHNNIDRLYARADVKMAIMKETAHLT